MIGEIVTDAQIGSEQGGQVASQSDVNHGLVEALMNTELTLDEAVISLQVAGGIAELAAENKHEEVSIMRGKILEAARLGIVSPDTAEIIIFASFI